MPGLEPGPLGRPWKAADLPDDLIVRTVAALEVATGRWVYWPDLLELLKPEPPAKVLLAKLARLERRRLLDGCPCGCRGDWQVTAAGAELLGSDETRLELARVPYCYDPADAPSAPNRGLDPRPLHV